MNDTTNQQILITKGGLEKLKRELEELVKVKRPKAVSRLASAKSQGDLSENSEYSAAMEELAFIDGRIDELEEIVRQAKTITPARGNKYTVDVGSTVSVKLNGKTVEFHIVGEWEADPEKRKISHSSPLGKALMGKKKGEKVEVEAPVGKVLYTIVDIK